MSNPRKTEVRTDFKFNFLTSTNCGELINIEKFMQYINNYQFSSFYTDEKVYADHIFLNDECLDEHVNYAKSFYSALRPESFTYFNENFIRAKLNAVSIGSILKVISTGVSYTETLFFKKHNDGWFFAQCLIKYY